MVKEHAINPFTMWQNSSRLYSGTTVRNVNDIHD